MGAKPGVRPGEVGVERVRCSLGQGRVGRLRAGQGAEHGQVQPQRVRVRHLERGAAGYVEDAVAAAAVDVAEAKAVRLVLRYRVSEGAAGGHPLAPPPPKNAPTT